MYFVEHDHDCYSLLEVDGSYLDLEFLVIVVIIIIVVVL